MLPSVYRRRSSCDGSFMLGLEPIGARFYLVVLQNCALPVAHVQN